MQKEADYLYRRPVESNTETPRECQILALVHTYRGQAIPNDVYNAVLGSAEREQENLKWVMDKINEASDLGEHKDMISTFITALSTSIALSSGVDGPKASDRRYKHLMAYFYEYFFSENYGPTE